jgi:hypothetical protein
MQIRKTNNNDSTP